MKRPTDVAPDVQQATRVLRAGGLVAFPTETVYGLGADARNPAAVARIFAAKGRPTDHPLIVHLAHAGELTGRAQQVPDAAWQLAESFWPGPLTLVLPRLAEVPAAVTGGLDTVALRVPAHPVARTLLQAFGSGIAAPSANRYGRVSPTSAADVRVEFGNEIDLVLDGGRCEVGIESTIVDLSSPTQRILRPGLVTAHALRRVLGGPALKAADAQVRAPGRKGSHYAPQARVVLASWEQLEQTVEGWRQHGSRVGVLAPYRPIPFPEDVVWLRLSGGVRAQAHALYRCLRQADNLELQVLVAVVPPDVGMGQALRDRLRRAAGLG